MVLRNLFRRRGRTVLTLFGIAIGVAAIVALGAMAGALREGFAAMTRGSEADFVVTQAGALTAILGSIDQAVADDPRAMPEVAAVDGMVFANSILDDGSYLFCFGYDPSGFSIRRFRIVAGERLDQASARRGRPLLLGRQAAERLHRKVGDVLYIGQVPFRVVGIIGAVISLREAQMLIGKPRQVQMYYIKLKRSEEAEAVRDRLKAAFPGVDFALTTEAEQVVSDLRVMEQMVGGISFLAVFIGAVGMLNTMLMSVLERTREIGVLRALGWRRRRVLGMILRESLLLGVLGGLCGTALGVLLGVGGARMPGIAQAFTPIFQPGLFLQAAVVSLVAGALGGLYPAWRATRMRPAEALRYE